MQRKILRTWVRDETKHTAFTYFSCARANRGRKHRTTNKPKSHARRYHNEPFNASNPSPSPHSDFFKTQIKHMSITPSTVHTHLMPTSNISRIQGVCDFETSFALEKMFIVLKPTNVIVPKDQPTNPQNIRLKMQNMVGKTYF